MIEAFKRAIMWEDPKEKIKENQKVREELIRCIYERIYPKEEKVAKS